MKAYKVLALTSVFSLSLAAAPASAADLIEDGDWQSFSFGQVGSAWSDVFTFNLIGSGEVRVTDAFNSGDRFEIFVNAISQGQTSDPTSVGLQIEDDYDSAFSDARWSSGSYILGPGSYTVSGIATSSPFGGGGAAIRLLSVTSAVPEPTTWAMMLLGFGFIGGAMRSVKRRQKITVSYA